MFFRTMLKHGSMLGAAIMLASVGLPSSASDVLTEADVRSIVEHQLRGDILKVKQEKVAGRTAYAVTIMNTGGDANHAYQVYTLIIDAETGTLMPETAELQPNQTKTAND